MNTKSVVSVFVRNLVLSYTLNGTAIYLLRNKSKKAKFITIGLISTCIVIGSVANDMAVAKKAK